MKRDLLVLLPAALLALLALPASGWIEPPAWLPATPWGYLPIALGVVAVFVIGVAVDGPLRMLVMALALSPFVAFGIAASPGARAPDLRWISFAVLAVLVSLVPKRWRLGVMGVGATVLVGGAVLLMAGLDVLPRRWTPFVPAPAQARSSEATPVVGVRRNTPVRVTQTPLGEGVGPWWVAATHAPRMGPRPHVLVLDGSRQAVKWSQPEMTVWIGSTSAQDPGSVRLPDDGFDLDAFDAVLTTDTAWSYQDPRADAYATAVAQYVRLGGTLIGVQGDEDWPEGLGRRLSAAGLGSNLGNMHARHLGLGRVLRVANRQGATLALLDDDAWVRDVTTVFRDGGRPAQLPAPLSRWRDDRSPRKPAGVVLLLVLLGLATFQRLLTGAAGRVAAAAVGIAGVAALAWMVPVQPAIHVEGLRFDLGGSGGRRVEAVWLSAGPTGYCGAVRWQAGGSLALVGASVDAAGQVVLRPHATAWAVRTSRGRGLETSDQEARDGSFLLTLLEGPVDPRRVRLGRGPLLPITVDGAGPVEAWTLRYRELK